MTFARHEVPSTTTQKLLRGCCVDISSSCEATSKRRALVYIYTSALRMLAASSPQEIPVGTHTVSAS